MRVKLAAGGAVLLLCILALVQMFMDITPEHPVEVSIPHGASGKQISERLEQAGVIRSGLAFRLLARITGKAAGLQSGDYRFEV
jgi:cell division protein YceG involved in septum cleavage